MSTITELRSRLDAAIGQRDLLLSQQRNIASEQVTNANEQLLLEKCAALCQSLTDSARQRVASVVAAVCSAPLPGVFQPGYALDVVHAPQPHRRRVSRVLGTDRVVSGNPMSVRGGSVTNVLGVFLPAALSLLRPDLIRPFFALDEPLGGVSGTRLDSAAAAVYALTHDNAHPVQIILTTQATNVWDDLADVRVHVTKNHSNGVVDVAVTQREDEDEL